MQGDPKNVHICVYGQGDQNVVLLHGWLHSSSRWAKLISELAPTYRVITIDIPGFGKSAPLKDQHADIYDNLLEVILEHLKDFVTLDSIHGLVGDSLGGLLWLTALGQQKICCKRLVLSGCPTEGFPWIIKMFLPVTALVGLNLLSLLPNGVQKWLIRFVSTLVVKQRAKIDSAYMNDVLHADPMTAFLVLRRIARPLSIEISGPHPDALVIRGEKDRVCSSSVAQKLAILIHAKQVVIKDAGHTPSMEFPDVYNREVSRFLAEKH